MIEAREVEKHFETDNAKPSAPIKLKVANQAFYGLAGDIVALNDPFSEADRAAVLATILAMFGNAIGRNPYFKVQYDRHYLNLFIALVGASSKGRKGLSKSIGRYIFGTIDRDWVDSRNTSGLSSGEGVVYAVRDERREKQPIKDKGRVVDYQEVIVDEGVQDKRLFVLEEELAQALKVMGREGNILSPIIRQAWDTGNLHPLTKHNPIKATDAHITIVGHITQDELLRHLDETEKANGFANRFIWFFVERSKKIADPPEIPAERLNPLVEKLCDSVVFARKVSEMKRDFETARRWESIYDDLSGEKPGLFGSIVNRAEAQTMRLACLYALLDQSAVIRLDHLNAALALWKYSEASARRIFGDALGDPFVDRIVGALKEHGQASETDIRDLFNHHSSKEIDRALDTMQRYGIAKPMVLKTGGRHKNLWVLLGDQSDKSDKSPAYVA